jgi:hypothetical protein
VERGRGPARRHRGCACASEGVGGGLLVFRRTHQLHGAVGFCDETTLSWLSRYSQPLRRLPFGLSATRDVLTRRIGRDGLTGLFGADRPVVS